MARKSTLVAVRLGAASALVGFALFSCLSQTDYEGSRSTPRDFNTDAINIGVVEAGANTGQPDLCPTEPPSVGASCPSELDDPRYNDVLRCSFPGPVCVVGKARYGVTLILCCFKSTWRLCEKTPTPCDTLEAGAPDAPAPAADAGPDGGDAEAADAGTDGAGDVPGEAG